MKLVDLSHKMETGMPVYQGDPEVFLRPIATVRVDQFSDHQLTCGMHAGTHVDAPSHVFENGKRLADYAPDQFMGRAVLIDARGKSSISGKLLDGIKLKKGDIVLVYTGWDQQYRSGKYYLKHPKIDETFAKVLIGSDVKMVGMDFPGPDESPFTVHKMLLENDILILENLTKLESLLKAKKIELMAFPLKLDTDGCPLRVIAKVS